MRSVHRAFVPVISTADEASLDRALSQPFSYVSTDGPKWLTAAQRRRQIEDDNSSHIIVLESSEVVGAVTWTKGQTPGFFRLSITSSRDDAWVPGLVEEAISQAMDLLLRSSEARRVELLFGVYNQSMLRYVTSADSFMVEGVLRDRFFLDGRFWSGVVCSADLEAFASSGSPASQDSENLLGLLRKKITDGLTSNRESLSQESSQLAPR